MRRSLSAVAVLWLLSGFASLTSAQPSGADSAHLRIVLDSAQHKIHLIAGPFDLRAKPGAADKLENYIVLPLRWPAEGWIYGWGADVKRADGAVLPHRLAYSVGLLDFERRDLIYDQVQRLLGVGAETEEVVLPRYIGWPMRVGAHMGVYVQLRSTSDTAARHAYLWLTVRWLRRGEGHPAEIYPFYADVGGDTLNIVSIPPGHSARSAEFRPALSGGLIVAGGHVPDHATSIRLEDGKSGKTLVRLKTTNDFASHVTRIARFIFGFHEEALRIEAGHPYRVVAEYDNPTGRRIEADAMGLIVGPFIPDDPKEWPRVDFKDPAIQRDLANLGIRDMSAVTPP